MSFTNTPTATQRNKIGADRIQLEALVVLLSIMMLASQFALSAFNAPSMGVAPALGAQRAEALTMFGGGKKAAPKKAGAKKPAGRKLVKSAANSKAARFDSAWRRYVFVVGCFAVRVAERVEKEGAYGGSGVGGMMGSSGGGGGGGSVATSPIIRSQQSGAFG